MRTKERYIARSEKQLNIPMRAFSKKYKKSLNAATNCLFEQQLLKRKTEDGLRVGIQASISTNSDGLGARDLPQIQREMRPSASVGQKDCPTNDTWQKVITDMQRRLGFSVEPEFFSNMLFASYLGHLPNNGIRALAQGLCDTYRDRSLFGLYGFFATMRFAADIDCTGVAMRSRLVLGEIDPSTKSGGEVLRATTSRILKSAAVAKVSAQENCNHGKENGALELNVFKVYLDDHEVQGALLDRGLKQDAAVVCHGLYSVLLEVAYGLRDLNEEIRLLEYVAGSESPRQRNETVDNIICANINFLRTQWEHPKVDRVRSFPTQKSSNPLR